jgi:hypothetical protein
MRPYLKKPFTKTGLVEWLKVKALSSSPSTAKKKGQVWPYPSRYCKDGGVTEGTSVLFLEVL